MEKGKTIFESFYCKISIELFNGKGFEKNDVYLSAILD